jgi:hypothetical protein
MGQAWVSPKHCSSRTYKQLILLEIMLRDTCFRNDGVRCSSHLSGTTNLQKLMYLAKLGGRSPSLYLLAGNMAGNNLVDSLGQFSQLLAQDANGR